MKISACVIVKNEENNLPRWIKNMQKIADEIIVVDTGSIDKTRQIAMAGGAKVYDFKWCDDFAAAKNFAITKATGNWIIFLDADEYFTEESLQKINKHILNVSEKIDAFLCKIINITDNQVVSSFYNLRIFRNKNNLRYKGCIHERLVNLFQKKVDAAVLSEDVIIYHTGYSAITTPVKIKRNFKLIKKDIQENGLRATHYIYLAECYAAMEDYDKAIKCCEKFIMANSDAIGMRVYIYCKWVELLIETKQNYLTAEKVLINAMREFPDNGEIQYFRARLLYLQKNYIKAEQYFKKILEVKIDSGNLNASMLEGKYAVIYDYLGQIYELKGQNDVAAEYYFKSLQKNSFNKEVLVNLYNQINGTDDISKIKLLNNIYNDKRKIIFLLDMLYNKFSEKISIYYKKLLKDKYNTNFAGSIEKDFFITGNITGTINMIVISLEDTYKFLVADAIKNKRDKGKLQDKITIDYYNILINYNTFKDIKTDIKNRKKSDDIDTIIKMSDRNRNNGE